MRLTKKENGKYYTEERACVLEIIGIAPSKFVGNDITKLGKYEDIDDEMGIDYPTLIKALKNGIFIQTQNRKKEIVYANGYEINFSFNGKEWVMFIDRGDFWRAVLTNDYGKTWALTKKELI